MRVRQMFDAPKSTADPPDGGRPAPAFMTAFRVERGAGPFCCRDWVEFQLFAFLPVKISAILRSAVVVALVSSVGFLVRAESAFVTKAIQVIQVSPDRVGFDATGTISPYLFDLFISGSATSPSGPIQFTPPGGGAPTPLTFGASFWAYSKGFQTRPAFESAYPNGIYIVTFGGRDATVVLDGDLYPHTLFAKFTNGSWSNGVINVDPSQPLDITTEVTENFLPGSTNLIITLAGTPSVMQASNNATTSQATLRVPAGTFVPGKIYSITLTGSRRVAFNTTAIPGSAIGAHYYSRTYIYLTAGAPIFTRQPASLVIAPNSTAVFSALANGGAYQWRRNGTSIPGATRSQLVLNGADATPATYTCMVSNGGGSTISDPATLKFGDAADPGRLVNLAIRTHAGTGAQTLIVGFSLGGPEGTKPLLLRGVGPTLQGFGVGGALGDPELSVMRDTTVFATNDNWSADTGVAAAASRLFAFPLTSTLDAALAIAPATGSYTAQVRGKAGATGIALAEIYDDGDAIYNPAAPRLINVSARTHVGSGDNVLIAGFVIGGSTAKTVLIRAIGPTLSDFGVADAIADPTLSLRSGSTVVEENDDWLGDPQIAAVAERIYAFRLPNLLSRDAVVLATLAPGTYTAQVSGVAGATGVGLVEVYEVP